MSKTKRCSHCGQAKPRSAFSRDRQKRDGLSGWCKSCRNENSAAWREQHGAEWRKRRAEEARYAEFDFRFD